MTRPASISLAFLALLPVTGCASSADSPECEVDLAARTLECVRDSDPNATTVDDERRATVRMTFAPGAFDGATRAVQGTADHVLTELSFAGETFDGSRTSGLEGDAEHDPLVEDALVWQRVHVLHLDEYARVDVVGEVAIDAAGHGHVHLEWGTPQPSSGRAGSGSMDATF